MGWWCDTLQHYDDVVVDDDVDFHLDCDAEASKFNRGRVFLARQQDTVGLVMFMMIISLSSLSS